MDGLCDCCKPFPPILQTQLAYIVGPYVYLRSANDFS